MHSRTATMLMAAGCAVALHVAGSGAVVAVSADAMQGGRGAAGGGVTSDLFTLVDTNKDDAVTREEMKSAFEAWFTRWDAAKAGTLSLEQVFLGLGASLPAPPPVRRRRPSPRIRRRDPKMSPR